MTYNRIAMTCGRSQARAARRAIGVASVVAVHGAALFGVGCDSRPPQSAPLPTATATALASSVRPLPAASVAASSTRATPEVAAPAVLSRTALMAHANHLASPKLNGRAAYTADERAAAAYLEEKLRRFGVSPIAAMGADARTGQTTYQLPFSVSASKASANVVGVVTGHDADQLGEYVVVGAHYDHLGRRNGQLYAGAEDNASGTAVVLEIARALVANQQRLGRSVMVVFFGAEEVGMVGSRQFVQHPPIAVSAMHSMVNIDMIGRPLADQAALAWPKRMMGIDARRSVGVLGTKNRPVFRAIVDKACHDAGISAVAPEDLPAGLQRQVEKQAQGRGDSFSFEDVKVPALFFSSGESDDYHEPSDTVDRLDPAVLELRAKAIFDVVVALTHAPRIDAASAKPAASGAP